MSIPAGAYLITAYNGQAVGRYPVEDLSLRPKAIYALPTGIAPPSWSVSLSDGFVDLKALGSPTGVYPGQTDGVYAFLITEMGNLGWTLERSRTGPPNSFKIRTKDGQRYWQVSTDERIGGTHPIVLRPGSDASSQVFTLIPLAQ